MFAAVSLHAWMDAYYALNADHPDSGLNFFSGIGTTASRADRLALNIAALDIARDPKPFGFHVTLVAGDSTDVVHLAEPHRSVRYVSQASVDYQHGNFGLEAGVYPSHIGFEGFFSKDNWNYTRGWTGELSPYYQSGLKASYAWNDKWSGQLHVLHGWQNVTDSNAPRAVGTQIAYSGARTSASFNTYIDAHRKFGDFIASYKLTQKLSLATQIDRGRQVPANWAGFGGYARYAFDDRHAVTFRAERFRDPDGGISGFAQRLTEGTATFEYRPAPHVIVKAEARRDRSTAAVFNGRNTQTLAIASAVVVY